MCTSHETSSVGRNLIALQCCSECHILRETEVPNVFLNLHGQAVEVTKEKVTTSFGFKNHIAADIVRDDKIHDLGGVVRACLTNDYLMHATPSCKDIFDLNLNDAQEIVDRCV